MKTIKLPFTVENYSSLQEDERVYSSAVRFSFNRFQEGFKKNDIYKLLTKTFHIGSHLLNCANQDAESVFKKEGVKKIQFGDFKRRIKNLITKEEYQSSRNRGFTSEGEKIQKGNRLFKFDIQNNIIVYKRNRKEHIVLHLPKLKKKIKDELLIVQEAMENKLITSTIKIKKGFLYITFDEQIISKKKVENLKNNRILGIDLNPNYIGFSVLEFLKDDSFKILHKEVIDLSLLQRKAKNKVKFELLEINHRIVRCASHYKCSKVCIEELTISPSNHHKGKNLNRLCNNEWRRTTTVQNLKLLCNIKGIELIEVNPAYSSFIGNCLYGDSTTPDMVASSIEIARRGYKKFSKGWFYPVYDSKSVSQKLNQWKEDVFGSCKSWIESYKQVKNSKMRYRVQLSECHGCFQKIYHKSFISKLCF